MDKTQPITMGINKDNLKDFMLVQSIEKQMRRLNRDIRRFTPKVNKAIKNYNLHVKRLNEMQEMMKQFTTKRDSLIQSLSGSNASKTSISQ